MVIKQPVTGIVEDQTNPATRWTWECMGSVLLSPLCGQTGSGINYRTSAMEARKDNVSCPRLQWPYSVFISNHTAADHADGELA